jgi:hypothetical protein
MKTGQTTDRQKGMIQSLQLLTHIIYFLQKRDNFTNWPALLLNDVSYFGSRTIHVFENKVPSKCLTDIWDY